MVREGVYKLGFCVGEIVEVLIEKCLFVFVYIKKVVVLLKKILGILLC